MWRRTQSYHMGENIGKTVKMIFSVVFYRDLDCHSVGA